MSAAPWNVVGSTDPFVDRDLSARKPGVKSTVAVRFGPHMRAVLFIHRAPSTLIVNRRLLRSTDRRGAVRGFLRQTAFQRFPPIGAMGVASTRKECESRLLGGRSQLRGDFFSADFFIPFRVTKIDSIHPTR